LCKLPFIFNRVRVLVIYSNRVYIKYTQDKKKWYGHSCRVFVYKTSCSVGTTGHVVGPCLTQCVAVTHYSGTTAASGASMCRHAQNNSSAARHTLQSWTQVLRLLSGGPNRIANNHRYIFYNISILFWGTITYVRISYVYNIVSLCIISIMRI
jgi:hypothetical protein